ncbi:MULTISPECIES: hypothetical protein [Nocardiopsis]|uniref:Uncharacterized protein n=2 Tax=Nocardiopsis alba TaxID=53437 RepID=A0A7K2IVW3_9ACTN|nr:MULTISPECIES: hypothetical protein [Nocardiopsis]AFR10304.1 hypothetical protein B005_3409 [Nocardiopsis alba ATCC BAA-2165]MEC3894333.1 hypothetical protein [Nocardiopsis sp. LDBS1602]MYR34119.1 hypothetical protein [Nocardiopsis alba]
MIREPLRSKPPVGDLEDSVLRAAVLRVAPDALTTFDTQQHHVRDLCSRNGDPAPVRMFLRRWGMFVELRSCPRRAARLARLELAVSEATDIETARAAAQEIALILDGATRRLPAP